MWKYCGRISKLSFLFFILFFHSFFLSSIRFFFFSLDFSPPHTYTHISPSSPFIFLYFPLDSRTSLSLSFSSSLSQLFFFFFYLILTHYPTLSVIRNGERGRERKNRWLSSAAPSALLSMPPRLPLRHCHSSSSPMQPKWSMACVFFSFSFSFFFFAFILMVNLINFKIMFLSLYFDYA